MLHILSWENMGGGDYCHFTGADAAASLSVCFSIMYYDTFWYVGQFPLAS